MERLEGRWRICPSGTANSGMGNRFCAFAPGVDQLAKAQNLLPARMKAYQFKNFQ
jgi:hypothetical protein